MRIVWFSFGAFIAISACAGDEPKPPGALAGVGGSSGSGGTGGSSATGGNGGNGGVGGADAGVESGVADAGPLTFEDQFPEVTDWNGLEIIYATSYTGFDGSHTFSVPMRVRCAVPPLGSWHADPPTAVTFSNDPDGQGGVWVTIVQPVEEITIAAVVGTRAGKATIHVTVGTPTQWALGDARYHTGPTWTLLNGTTVQPPPPDMRCIACHGANSSVGFNVMVTPTQVARMPDAALRRIMTDGVKPDDVGFRTYPPSTPFGSTTLSDVEFYSRSHLWSAGEDELAGMVLYLRSLDPLGYGCIYVPPVGTMPAQCIDVLSDASLECQ